MFLQFSSILKSFRYGLDKGPTHINKKNIGINGHMFKWIANVITDRTFQVRIGDEQSNIYILENGTSQGLIISPTLFLMMINDMPNSLCNISVSLFADNSTFFKPEPNIVWLQRAVQKKFDVLQHWCNIWGFKIFIEKTVGVLFTHSTNRPNIKIKVGGSPINIKHSARFLGMIFNKSFTWSEHTEYVIYKCNKRLNLMRAVSGTRWGANETSLLTICRMLIRSILDYGAAAYDSASISQLRKLDKIQYSALKLCFGTMKSTAASALQVESGETPLHLSRLKQQISS